jgi:predicted DNA-binding transcriptional regulator YafY
LRYPRISNAVMLETAYSGDVVTPEDFFDGSMGVFSGSKIESVEIEFEAEVSQYVRERRWHQSQKTTALPNGRVRVALEVSDSPELHSWILGFGPSAKVISPSSLAEKVAVRAIETAERYKRKIG